MISLFFRFDHTSTRIIITSNTEPILTKELTSSNEPKKHIGLSDEVKEKRDKYKEFSKYKSSKN
jgi:hypothetical protein